VNETSSIWGDPVEVLDVEDSKVFDFSNGFLLIEASDSSRLSNARDHEIQGSIEDTERVWLPRWSAIPHHFKPVQVYRRVLFVGDIFVENFVGIERSEHVLL
jgi:hypothetical protein